MSATRRKSLRWPVDEKSYFFFAGDFSVFGEPAGDGAVLAALPGVPVFALVFALVFAFEDAVLLFVSGCVEGVKVVVTGAFVAAGEACGVASDSADCTTERLPVSEGIESSNATSIKAAAAPMVIFESRVCVPRGPKAVDDTLLEKSAPASALPGCNSTVTTSTRHARIKRPYKT